jgi:uncharacterized membrane protein (DUF2068 family)
MASAQAPPKEADTGLKEGLNVVATNTTGEVLYSVFTKAQKRYIVFFASWAGFFSPVSSQIYFPALNSIADDLGVTSALINLTLTSYMVYFAVIPITAID